MTIDKSNYYSSLTPEFTSSCTIKSISPPFINKTLEPARKLKYESQIRDIECVKMGMTVEQCESCTKDWTKCGTCPVMIKWVKEHKHE